MKPKILFTLFATILTSPLSWSAAICQSRSGQVTVHDSRSITLSGISSPGLKNGRYNCSLPVVTPGFLALQSLLTCQATGGSNAAIQVWMIEGLSAVGSRAASVTLYKNGLKVFEAACSRPN